MLFARLRQFAALFLLRKEKEGKLIINEDSPGKECFPFTDGVMDISFQFSNIVVEKVKKYANDNDISIDKIVILTSNEMDIFDDINSVEHIKTNSNFSYSFVKDNSGKITCYLVLMGILSSE